MSGWRQRLLRAWAFAAVSLTSLSAFACPVCGAAKDDATRDAFILTTVFMSLLPLAMLGGLAWWLIRRLRQLDLEEKSAQETAVRLR